MPLSQFEELSGGQVRDQDERMVISVATGAGKNLQFASISTAASGATQLVAAQTLGQIKVVSYVIVAAAAVSVKFQSGGTDLTGAMALAANGGVVAPSSSGAHWFQTAANTALNINLGGAIQVSGHVGYFVE